MTIWRDSRTRRYRAKFEYKGERYEKKGFPTRASALKWETAAREELANPKPLAIRITFSEIAGRYLDACSARMALNTWRQKSYVYNCFLRFLKDLEVEECPAAAVADPFDPPAIEITRSHIEQYLEHRRHQSGNTSANRDLRDLKALYRWVNDHEDIGITRNPCKGIEQYPEQKKVQYVPPAEDIDKVLLAATEDDLDILVAVYHTAARIGEILRLAWEDVNFEKGTVRLWTRKRRRGELQEDYLALTDTLKKVLERRWKNRLKTSPYVFPGRADGHVSYGSKRNLMRSLCQRAGVKFFGFKAIRHHVASILEDSGKATLGQIQKQLRHKRKTTTEIYLHMLDRDLTQVAELIEKQSRPRGEENDPPATDSLPKSAPNEDLG